MIPIPAGLLVKGGIAALLLALGFWGGCSVQSNRDEDKLEAMRLDLREAGVALGAANASLKASASALRAQNTANAKAIAEERLRLDAAEAARSVAERAEADAARRASDFAAELARIKARRPACKALLDTNVRQTCGL